MEAYEARADTAADMHARRQALAEERQTTVAILEVAQAESRQAQRQSVDIERIVQQLATAYDLFDTLRVDEQRAPLHDLIDHIATDRVGGTIVLKTQFAGMARALLQHDIVEKNFGVGAPTRTRWAIEREVRETPRAEVLFQQQTGSHSVSFQMRLWTLRGA